MVEYQSLEVATKLQLSLGKRLSDALYSLWIHMTTASNDLCPQCSPLLDGVQWVPALVRVRATATNKIKDTVILCLVGGVASLTGHCASPNNLSHQDTPQMASHSLHKHSSTVTASGGEARYDSGSILH